MYSLKRKVTSLKNIYYVKHKPIFNIKVNKNYKAWRGST